MNKFFVLLLALAISFAACNKEKEEARPAIEVNFSTEMLGTFSPCKVKFYPSTQSDVYEWSFDDQAATSNSKFPEVVFFVPGTYNITLKVSGVKGVGEITKTVVIPPAATQMKINSIVLSQYPMQNLTGNSWDPSPYSNPDINFKILGVKPSYPMLYKHTVKMQDVSAMKDITFTIPNGLLLPLVDDDYSFVVFDWDEFSDEFMGHVSFNPWHYLSTLGYYPDSFSGSQEGVTATFYVTWQ